MTISVSTMFIAVHDPVAALGFYSDVLGLEVRKDISNGGHRWLTVGAPGQAVDIVLFHPAAGRSQEEGDAILKLVVQGSIQGAIFTTDDLDALFAHARDAGVEVIEEPTDQFWGVRDCAFRDPSGNLIRVAQAA